MIDLRNKELPSRLEWDGGSCVIRTDFRVWLSFGEWWKQGKAWLGIFPDGIPDGDDWQRAAYLFYQCPNELPRATRTPSKVRYLDMMIDAPFIVASFQQAYGIDLTSCDMHWHRFCALLDGLPDDTKMARIMSYRGYNPADEKRKHSDYMQERKMAWALPNGEENDETGGFGALINAYGL